MSKEKKDCLLYGENCVSDEEHIEHKKILFQALKIVYCKAKDCVWNKEISQQHTIPHNKNYVPLGLNEGYKGICLRKEIGLSKTEKQDGIGNFSVRYILAKCDFYAAGVKNHIDFSKLLDESGQPQGGSIESQSSDQDFTNEPFH